MIARIEDETVPNLLLLQYTPSWGIRNLWAIHRLLLTREVIEKRKPLSTSARRAGWIGCNILLGKIPPEGRIPLIREGVEVKQDRVRERYALGEKFKPFSPVARGWTTAVLEALHNLHKPLFTVADAYAIEAKMSKLYPSNKNVRPKIRQQLQVLRDAGLLVVETRGVYRFAIESLTTGISDVRTRALVRQLL